MIFDEIDLTKNNWTTATPKTLKELVTGCELVDVLAPDTFNLPNNKEYVDLFYMAYKCNGLPNTYIVVKIDTYGYLCKYVEYEKEPIDETPIDIQTAIFFLQDESEGE